jgi:hypothetical protein
LRSGDLPAALTCYGVRVDWIEGLRAGLAA